MLIQLSAYIYFRIWHVSRHEQSEIVLAFCFDLLSETVIILTRWQKSSYT